MTKQGELEHMKNNTTCPKCGESLNDNGGYGWYGVIQEDDKPVFICVKCWNEIHENKELLKGETR